MDYSSKMATAIRLYYEGVPIWQIAETLGTTEAKVVAWIGLG